METRGVQYLMPIGAAEPLLWILERSCTALGQHRSDIAKRLRPGDRLFIYISKAAFGSSRAKGGRIVANALVSESAKRLDSPIRFGERIYQYLVRLTFDRTAPCGSGVELAPLVSRLPRTFPDAAYYTARLRRAPFVVEPQEAALVDELLAPLTVEHSIAALSYRRALPSAARLLDSRQE